MYILHLALKMNRIHTSGLLAIRNSKRKAQGVNVMSLKSKLADFSVDNVVYTIHAPVTTPSAARALQRRCVQ